MKASKLVVGGVIVVVCLMAGAMVALNHMPARIPAKRIDIAAGVNGVWAGRTYAYVLRHDTCVLLVDAGSDPAGTALLGELATHNLAVDNVSAVLLTHGHFDHRAALHLFPHAKVIVAGDDAALARGETLPRAALPRLMQRVYPESPPPPQNFDMPLPGSQLRVCEQDIDVVALPGHTPGSLAYRIGDTLFAGDAVHLTDDSVAGPQWVWSDNAEHGSAVLTRLRDLPFVGIATGHDGYAPDGQARLKRAMTQSTAGTGRTAITAGNG